MSGKTVMVTGATSGIGKVTARVLASRGARVIIVGRNESKSADTVRFIQSQTGSESVEYLLADFSDLDQVRSLAAAFTNGHSRLDVLVNNAGAFFNRRRMTRYGVEMTLLVNHLAPFLLTRLLVGHLRESAPSRIVNVSSDAHPYGSMEFDDLGFSRGYFGFKAYARSKLANVLFTTELAKQLKGSGVTVNAVHPGHVATDIWKTNFPVIGPLLKWVTGLFALTPEEGAEPLIHLASSPVVDGMSGAYFDRMEIGESSQLARDESVARELWKICEGLTQTAEA